MGLDLVKLTNSFDIVQNETGVYEITNYETIRDTLQSIVESATNLVVTSSESSVDSAKKTKKELSTLRDKVDESFEEFMEAIEKVTEGRKELKRLCKDGEDELAKMINEAKELWIQEAFSEYERILSFEATHEIVDRKLFSRKQTKKSIFDTMETELIRLEAEYGKRMEDEETLEAYCKKAGQPPEAFKPLLDTMELKDVFKAVDEAERKQAEQLELERERREKLERESQKAKAEVEEVINKLDTYEDVTPVNRLWELQLWLTDRQKAMLKDWLDDNNIKLEKAKNLKWQVATNLKQH